MNIIIQENGFSISKIISDLSKKDNEKKKEAGIKGYTSLKKAELIEALTK